MDSWKSLLITFAMIGICVYSILNFGYWLQISNGINNTILNEPVFNSLNSSIVSNFNDLQIASNSQKNVSLNEQGTLSNPSGALLLGSIFSSFGRFFSFLFDFGYALIGLSGNLIQDKLITGVLASLLIIIIVFSSWKLLKQGS